MFTLDNTEIRYVSAEEVETGSFYIIRQFHTFTRMNEDLHGQIVWIPHREAIDTATLPSSYWQAYNVQPEDRIDLFGPLGVIRNDLMSSAMARTRRRSARRIDRIRSEIPEENNMIPKDELEAEEEDDGDKTPTNEWSDGSTTPTSEMIEEKEDVLEKEKEIIPYPHEGPYYAGWHRRILLIVP